MATATLLSQRARPRCCGRGLAWKALLEAVWHGFPPSAATNRNEAAPPVSAPRPAHRTGGKKVVRAPPPFWPLVRHGGGQRGTGVRTPFASPFSGSLSPQRSLAGRPPDVQSRSRWMSVTACSFVIFLSLDVLLCIWMLHRVPLHIHVSSESRQWLQLLRTRRVLQAWLSPWPCLLTPRGPRRSAALGPGNAPSRSSTCVGARTGPSGHRPPPPGCGPHAPGPPRSLPGDGRTASEFS